MTYLKNKPVSTITLASQHQILVSNGDIPCKVSKVLPAKFPSWLLAYQKLNKGWNAGVFSSRDVRPIIQIWLEIDNRADLCSNLENAHIFSGCYRNVICIYDTDQLCLRLLSTERENLWKRDDLCSKCSRDVVGWVGWVGWVKVLWGHTGVEWGGSLHENHLRIMGTSENQWESLESLMNHQESFLTSIYLSISLLKVNLSLLQYSDGRQQTHLILAALCPLYQMAAPLYCAQNYSVWPNFLGGGRASGCHTMWCCLLSVSNALSTAYLIYIALLHKFIIISEVLYNIHLCKACQCFIPTWGGATPSLFNSPGSIQVT